MAEKRRTKKRKEDYVAPGEKVEEKPAKDEYQIAKWLRKNVQIKKTKFMNHNVEYFTGKKAVDALMESSYSQGEDPFFKSREDIVDYLHLMLVHKFFHRAKKIPVSELELKGKKKEKKDKEKEISEKEVSSTKEIEKEKVTDNDSLAEGSKEQQPEKEKKKKKIRLDMHIDQRFVDSLDAYVWIYDPIPFYYWIMGTFFVLGAIGICLFPLWPPSVRLGVYYLSIAAAGFLVSIIVLVILRLIIFSLIWLLTWGRHHLWILPNLTEDVGFFASFWPLYTYEYKGPGSTSQQKKKKKKEKLSDAEDDEEVKKKVEEKTIPLQNEAETNNEEKDVKSSETIDNQVENLGGNSETESESSQRSSTGKDFEIVDQQDLESS